MVISLELNLFLKNHFIFPPSLWFFIKLIICILLVALCVKMIKQKKINLSNINKILNIVQV